VHIPLTAASSSATWRARERERERQPLAAARSLHARNPIVCLVARWCTQVGEQWSSEEGGRTFLRIERSAPLRSRYSSVSPWPRAAAIIKAVSPALVLALMSAPFSISSEIKFQLSVRSRDGDRSAQGSSSASTHLTHPPSRQDAAPCCRRHQRHRDLHRTR